MKLQVNRPIPPKRYSFTELVAGDIVLYIANAGNGVSAVYSKDADAKCVYFAVKDSLGNITLVSLTATNVFMLKASQQTHTL